MNCERLNETVVAFLDGETSPAEAAQIQAHLTGCAHCAHEIRALERTRAWTSRALSAPVSRPGGTAATFDDLWHRLETRASDSKAPIALSRVARGQGDASRLTVRRRSLGAARWRMRTAVIAATGMAAAAGLALTLYSREPNPASTASPAGAAAGAHLAQSEARRARPAVVASESRHGRGNGRAGTELADAQPALSEHDLPVPDELRQSPGLFVDYPIVRHLNALRHLEAVMDEPADGQKSS